MHRVMDVIRDWSLLVVVSLVTLMCIVRYQLGKSQKLPPGPFALPVIGNLHMLGNQPWRSLKNLADKHGSLLFRRLGSVPTVVISSSESAKLFFKAHDLARQMVEVSKEFDIFANAVLKEHTALGKPASDEVASFIDVLLEISKGDPNFTHENIKAIILDMTIAATGTTGAILEWVTCLLLKHPTCLSALQKEINEVVGSNEALKEEHLSKMKYLKCVVKEGMRLYAPSPLGFPRESTEAVVMNDYFIPKGTRLLVNLWAIGRDPEVWDKPDEFIPERFAELDDIDFTGWSDFKSLPFSAGRRGCPGVNPAMPTILLGLATLFHSFQISVDGDHSMIDMGEKNSIVMSRENPLFAHLKLALNTSTLYFENQ